MSEKVWSTIIFLLLLAAVVFSFLKPLNKIGEASGLLCLIVFGAFCLFEPLKAIKMSEGPRWSLGRKLDLDANPPSKRAIILLRIFGVLLILFLLKTLFNLFHP